MSLLLVLFIAFLLCDPQDLMRHIQQALRLIGKVRRWCAQHLSSLE